MNGMQQLPGAAPQPPQIANAPTQLPTQAGGMPGQQDTSGIAQLLSKQGGGAGTPTPTGISPSLTTLPKEALQAAIMGEGGTGIQPVAALAELSKRIKAEKMAAMQQGQQAMQAAQGMRPIKDQVLEEAGIGSVPRPPMQLAQGGIVAFAEGGTTPYTGMGEYGGMDAPQFAMDTLRREELLEKRRRADVKERYEYVKQTSPVAAQRMLAENPWLEAGSTPQPAPSAAAPAPTVPSPAAAAAPGPQAPAGGPPTAGPGVGMRVGASSSSRGAGGIGALPGAQAPGFTSDLSGVKDAYGKQIKALENRRVLPEEVLAGRKSVDELMSSIITQEREEAAKAEREAVAERERVEAANSKPMFSDPRMLMAMAGGMSTKRGEIFGSLARGTGKELGRRADDIEDARKTEIAAKKDVRGMNQANRQRQALEIARQQAIREKDYDRLGQIDEQIAALAMGQATTELTTKQGDYNRGLEGRKVSADEMRAMAAVKQAEAAMISAALSKQGISQDRQDRLRLQVITAAQSRGGYKEREEQIAAARVALGAKPGAPNPELVNRINTLQAMQQQVVDEIAAQVGVQMGRAPAAPAAPAATAPNSPLWKNMKEVSTK